MKKLGRFLITLALSAPLLGGCSLSDLLNDYPEETQDFNMELRDYTTSAALNSKYNFDGKVYVVYLDNTEKDVTSYCNFRDVDTSKVGQSEFRVDYVTKSKLYYKISYITVFDPSSVDPSDPVDPVDPPVETKELERIEIRDYAPSVALNGTYEFTGKVYAVFDNQTEEEISSSCTFSTVDTSNVGNVEFKVEYVLDEQTYNAVVNIYVYDPEAKGELQSISVSNYTDNVEKGAVYTFDGQVYAKYEGIDESILVTSECIFTNIDTSSVGKKSVTISFTDSYVDILGVEHSVTKSQTITIKVYDPSLRSELLSISVSDYKSEVKKGETYTFDGKVYATYSGVDEPVLLNNSDCNIGTISTTQAGSKNLTISYTDKYNDANHEEKSVTKSKTISINVYVNPTSISASDIKLGVDASKKIELTFSPTDTTKKDVTFVSNNESIATVDSQGNVTGKSVGSTTIKITSTAVSTVTKTINVTVSDEVKDAWTVLMYVCGADLESASGSDGGQATADLKEIASVSGQPDDVNVVVQAGGAKSWKSTYQSVINSSYANRFHLNNKSYVKDAQIAKANMGLTSTLQSFLTWGIETYPAENYGLIFWNHGGAMTGCCFDEQYSDDSITPEEVAQAIKGARTATGMTDKFEFIGYDCCLMQVQDIAGLNSEYAKYQVASEESEWGYGWTYDGWIDDLFAKKSTENILKAIVDSFKSETIRQMGSGSSNDQTLSYLDLSKWAAYETAWEDMASTLSGVVNSSSKWSTLASVINSCQKYGESSDGWNTVYPFDVFDAGSFCTKMKASSSYKSNTTLMNKITAVQNAESDLVAYEWHGGGSSGSTGVAMFAPLSGYSYKTEYSETQTTLSTWRSICINYGSWYY